MGAKIVNGELLLEVADNGAGLAQNGNGNGANGSQHRGLGLSNVRERLRQLYDENHSFELKPAPEGGLLARISLPLTLSGQTAAASSNLN